MTSPALTPEQILAGIEPVAWIPRSRWDELNQPGDHVAIQTLVHRDEPRRPDLYIPLYTAAAIAPLVERLEKAERRAYELAVAIMGGEDAPEYADSVPTAALTFAIRDERAKAAPTTGDNK